MTEGNSQTAIPDPVVEAGTEMAVSLINEVAALLTASQDAEIEWTNTTGHDFTLYGYKATHGEFMESPPNIIPAPTSTQTAGMEGVFGSKSTGNGAAGVVVYTFETGGQTYVMSLVYQNPCWSQSGRGVMLDTDSTATWPPVDTSTNEQYTPTEFCNALWQHKTVDPITGWPLSGVWETMTNPTQVGNLDVWIVAKWSGTGKDGLVEVFFAPSQDEVVAMVRKSMH